MGYSVDFEGQFNLSKPLSLKHKRYLEAFADTRHCIRKTDYNDPIRDEVNLPFGVDGEFYVGDITEAHNYNETPSTQPSLWCQWSPNEDGTAIVGVGEKFYEYVDWIKYIVDNFIIPWGYKLNGTVKWTGEDHNDIGRIIIEDNKVKTQNGTIVYA